MAFIVPVMKKDYALYGKKGKSEMVPRRMTMPSRLETTKPVIPALTLTDRPLTPPSSSSSPNSSPSTSPTSPSMTRPRRTSRRISIRHLNESSIDSGCRMDSIAEDDKPLSADDPIKRHVHFGFCEEIQYSSDEEDENERDIMAAKKKWVAEKSNSVPAPGVKKGIMMRGRSHSASELAHKDKGIFSNVIKFAKFCSLKN